MESDNPGFDYRSIDSGYYDRVFRRRRGVQSRWHHSKFARIRDEMGPYQDHLDIGCGPGTFVGTLGACRMSVGVDIAEGQVGYAHRTYGSSHRRFVRVASGPLPFRDASFDVATMIELAEHLTGTANRHLLAEVHRVLRPGGRVLVSTPNYASLWPLIEWLVDRIGPVAYGAQHVTHYDRGRLARLLRDAGFGAISVSAYQWLAPFTAVLGWTLADRAARIEPRLLVDRLGFLLLATGTKPS